MSWIAVAEQERPTTEAPVERRVQIEDLDEGKIFSINTQATKFSLRAIDINPSEGFPQGVVLARTVNSDGSFGGDVALDYGEHRRAPVLVWNSVFGADDLAKPYVLFERVQLKGSDLKGTILDLNKSKFPDVDIIVMWDAPLHGDPITEVHGHEMESLGEVLGEHATIQAPDGQERSLAEIRAGVMDLRGKHEKKFEDQTRDTVRQQISEITAQREFAVKQASESQKAEVAAACSAIIEQHASTCRAITDACLLHVSAGDHNYELEYVGHVLTMYADSLYQVASRVTSDPAIAAAATQEVLNVVADATWRSFFLTRLAYIRRQPNGQCCVFSERGKNLGRYASKEKAQHRLRQVEYFKRKGAEIDLEAVESLDEVRL